MAINSNEGGAWTPNDVIAIKKSPVDEAQKLADKWAEFLRANNLGGGLFVLTTSNSSADQLVFGALIGLLKERGIVLKSHSTAPLSHGADGSMQMLLTLHLECVGDTPRLVALG